MEHILIDYDIIVHVPLVERRREERSDERKIWSWC